MKKLTLQVDELAVESFEPDAAPARERGTVLGAEETLKVICGISTLKTDLTCCPCTPMY